MGVVQSTLSSPAPVLKVLSTKAINKYYYYCRNTGSQGVQSTFYKKNTQVCYIYTYTGAVPNVQFPWVVYRQYGFHMYTEPNMGKCHILSQSVKHTIAVYNLQDQSFNSHTLHTCIHICFPSPSSDRFSPG